MENKKGQVWIETVIYTLIGLVLIGTVLAFATPFINEQKDRAVIERSVQSMNLLDNTILNAKGQGIGNKREFNFQIGKGYLEIRPNENEIVFVVEESNHAFSEVGGTIDISGTNLRSRTKKNGKKYDVTISLEYDESVDIRYEYEEDATGTTDNGNIARSLDAAPNPYRLIIENLGRIPVADTTETCSIVDGPDVGTDPDTDGDICTITETDRSNSLSVPGTCRGTSCVPKYVKINIYDAS